MLFSFKNRIIYCIIDGFQSLIVSIDDTLVSEGVASLTFADEAFKSSIGNSSNLLIQVNIT